MVWSSPEVKDDPKDDEANDGNNLDGAGDVERSSVGLAGL